jgi:hypothetical protein
VVGPPLSYDDFCAEVAGGLGLPVEQVRSSGPILVDLSLDELSLAELLFVVEGLNPHFRLPEQMELEDVTMADVHHFYCVMTSGHDEPEGAAP